MENDAPSPLPPARPATEPSKHDKRIVVAWVLTGLMALAAAAFAWLYYGKDEPVQPSAQTQQTNQSDQADAADKDEEVEPVKTVYQAEIGKFKLDLGAKYAVIERLDGGFEGGPATSVEIGETSTNTPNIVVTNPAQAFTVFARPESDATLADNDLTLALEDNEIATREDDSTFAGTPARVYRVDGLFSIRHTVFVKNGIVYEITVISEDAVQDAMFEAVEAGFSFVE